MNRPALPDHHATRSQGEALAQCLRPLYHLGEAKRRIAAEGIIVEPADIRGIARDAASQGEFYRLAIESLPMAVAVFDREQRLLTSNRLYCELLGLSQDLQRPGTAYHELLADRAGKQQAGLGVVGAQDRLLVAAHLRALAEGRGGSAVIETKAAGAVHVRRTPLGNGGWVETAAAAAGAEDGDWTRELIRYDELTGLAKQLHFQSALKDALASGAGAVFCLRIDNLFELQGFLGPGGGERVIRAFADTLGGLVAEGQTLARLGDIRFAILAPGVAARDAAVIFAERLLTKIDTRAVRLPDGVEVMVRATIGFTLFPAHGLEPAELIEQSEFAVADAQETHVRQAGFAPETHERARRRGAIAHALRTALERGQLDVHYQPKIALKSRRVVGMEALMRWRGDDGRFIPPGEFIPVAEKAGAIGALTDWMLQEACRQTKAWSEAGYDHLCCSVNISTAHFQRQSVIASVTSALEDADLDPSQLEIEITESILLDNDDFVTQTFSWLKDIGVTLSIDDFGTGYAALSYLKDFDLDKVKIDQSFIRTMKKKSDVAKISKAIIRLAHSLDMIVIAEGVETKEHADILEKYDCDQVQGYYFGRPMPAQDFFAFLSRPITI